ncbi:MAG: hypothetical protein U1E76_09515 [Planctomycetota bacterium]
MRFPWVGLASLALAVPVLANDTVDSAIYATTTTRRPNSGWVVQFPTGSEDYFNAVFDVIAGSGNADGQNVVADGLPITSIAVSVADFGSGRTYATVGVYTPNLAVDSTGATPDLASPVSQSFSPVLSPPVLFDYVVFDLNEGAIPGGQTKVHGVEQFPPGDSGLLGIGADTRGTGLRAGLTTDGYATPALVISFLEFGINPGQDNTATASCKQGDRAPHGRLRVASNTQVGSGDHLTTKVRPGAALQLAFLGTSSGDRVRLYYDLAPCLPVVAIGPVLPAIPDRDGDGSYLRWNATWPSGFGGQTLRFSAAWGNAACSNPGAGFTNCVTVVTYPDPTFGVLDDGTIENGWVNGFPAGPSDYFNNHFGVPPSNVNGVVGLTLAVLDFVTTTPSFASAGVSNANLAVDPSGQTPDVRGPGVLAVVAPFTFPSGTFATTSNQYVSHAVAVPGAALGSHVHGWMQFTPGEPGFVGMGADTSSPANGLSAWSMDGYTSPANVVTYANWGIRIATN